MFLVLTFDEDHIEDARQLSNLAIVIRFSGNLLLGGFVSSSTFQFFI